MRGKKVRKIRALIIKLLGGNYTPNQFRKLKRVYKKGVTTVRVPL